MTSWCHAAVMTAAAVNNNNWMYSTKIRSCTEEELMMEGAAVVRDVIVGQGAGGGEKC